MVCQCDLCRDILKSIASAPPDPDQCRGYRGFAIPAGGDSTYQCQLNVKQVYAARKHGLTSFDEIIPSTPLHHRLRVKFTIRRDPSTEKFIMGVCETDNQFVATNTFPVASQRINDMMPLVLRILNTNMTPLLCSRIQECNLLDTMCGSYFQTTFVLASTQPPQLSATVDQTNADTNIHTDTQPTTIEELRYIATELHNLYHNKLNIENESSSSSSISSTPATDTTIKVMARWKGHTLVATKTGLDEVNTICESGLFHGYKLMQSEGSFSNPNGIVAGRVNAWLVKELSALTKGQLRMLELCSGCGNHTIGLASCYTTALCIEIDKRLCDDAVCNMQLNGLSDRVKIIQGDMKHTRRFVKRVWGDRVYSSEDSPSNPIVSPGENAKYGDNGLLAMVDPPRSGLSNGAVDVLFFTHINYITRL